MTKPRFQMRTLSVPDKSKAKIIHVGGEIDTLSLDEFKIQFSSHLSKKGIETFIVFLRDLNFIDSSVIGYLAEVFTKMKKENRKMVFTEASSNILDILELVGFLSLVEYHPTIDDAIDSLEF